MSADREPKFKTDQKLWACHFLHCQYWPSQKREEKGSAWRLCCCYLIQSANNCVRENKTAQRGGKRKTHGIQEY